METCNRIISYTSQFKPPKNLISIITQFADSVSFDLDYHEHAFNLIVSQVVTNPETLKKYEVVLKKFSWYSNSYCELNN